jgi:hypothetical protein
LPATIEAAAVLIVDVAADVIGVGVGIDDHPDRLVTTDFLDLGEQLVAEWRQHRVNDEDAVVADGHRRR